MVRDPSPSPGSAGDICAHELSSGELLLEKGAYLASSEGVTCDAKWDGLRGFFNEGMFVLRVTGTGTLFFHAYGDVSPVDVSGEYVVDNGYAVAWEPTLTYQLTRGRRIRSFLFADQLLLRFYGQGRIWLQSRSPPRWPTGSIRSAGWRARTTNPGCILLMTSEATPRIGILTVSDRASRGEYVDRGGPAIREYLDEVLSSPWQAVSAWFPTNCRRLLRHCRKWPIRKDAA